MMHEALGTTREHDLAAERPWCCPRCRDGLLDFLPSVEDLVFPARERDEVAAAARRARRAESRLLA